MIPKRPAPTPYLFAFILFLLGSTADAQQGKTPFCLPGEPLAPNGIVLRMGNEYYRTCGSWSEKGLLWRQFLLKMNPSLVPNLFSAYSPTNLTVVENVEGIDRREAHKRSLANNGTRVFGDVSYQSYESKPMGTSGKPHRGTYVYIAQEGTDGIPTHWVTCAGWARIEEGRSLICHVFLTKGDVTASLLFIGSKKRGFAFVDHFSEFAQDIERVLDVANVTSDLSEMATFLDIVE